MKWTTMSARERDLLMAEIVSGKPNEVVALEARDAQAPPYTREMGTAWQVVDYLNNRILPDGARVTLAGLDYASAARAWHAAFQAATGSSRAWTAGAWAATPAEALCQAALLVLEYDLDALPPA